MLGKKQKQKQKKPIRQKRNLMLSYDSFEISACHRCPAHSPNGLLGTEPGGQVSCVPFSLSCAQHRALCLAQPTRLMRKWPEGPAMGLAWRECVHVCIL